MAHTQDEKQRVYLACRAIFTGDRALLRKLKKVREEVNKNARLLAPLTNELGLEKVVRILSGLLEQRIFENELRAKIAFPSLFCSSPEQEARREASETEAVKSTAEAIEEIASVNDVEADIDNEGAKCTPDQDEMDRGGPVQTQIVDENAQGSCGKHQTDNKEHTKTLPSLYPILIPYHVQHLILNEAQRLLEESCFQFAQTWFPSVLKARGWDCARSLELTRWTRVLANAANGIPREAFRIGEQQQLDEVLSATDSLRHSAVHRLPSTARGIVEMVKAGVTMASVLGDIRRAAQLEVMCDELTSKAKGLEVYKNALENAAKRRLDDIQQQREKLDQQEKDVVQDMLKDDAEYRAVVGVLLEDAITGILREHRESQKEEEDVPAGQDSVDQSKASSQSNRASKSKVSEIIYNASKGSKYFNREEVKDKVLTQKIDQILEKKRRLEKLDLTRELRAADQLIAQLELSRDLTQHIVHVDCDAFYAAVEQLDRPEIEHVPFAVGGGVLTTCNYVARKFGVRSGMAGFVAKKLCPDLLLLRPNFDKYSAKAQEVREILAHYDPRFESASIDEAYLNVTQYCSEHAMTPQDAVQQMRREIHEKTKVTVSAGIAANARLAKICSNMNKPNGQYILPNERSAIMDFMGDLSTRKVNGIGRVLERELQEIGIKTCGDIYPHRRLLRQLFGDKTYEFLIVQPAEEYERKSVGTEKKLRWTAEELERDMRRVECKGRTLVLTRQVATPKAICQADDLYNYALPILTKLKQEVPNMRLRLLGLRCTNLVSTKKPDARAFFGLKPLRLEHTNESTTISRKRSVGNIIYDLEGEEEILPDPTKQAQIPEQNERWDCPICSRPQQPNERLFNNHIDLCLSRQAIRDTVHEGSKRSPTKSTEMPPSKKLKGNRDKKRGRPTSTNDPRQTKLFFS
ncbi:hypothetical protein F4810DRAFT_702529 [Camillea tinctor]|nr:hypothetical protein F4810DRAFT_702529 [Camillea tinctor]